MHQKNYDDMGKNYGNFKEREREKEKEKRMKNSS